MAHHALGVNHHHRVLLSLPHRHKVTGPDGNYLPELASLPRLAANEQAGMPRILFPRRDAETVVDAHGLPDRFQRVRIQRQRPSFRPHYRQRPNGSTRPQNLASSTQRDCMTTVEPARRFTMLCFIIRPDAADDLLLQLPPGHAQADHQANGKHSRPHAA